MNEDEVIDTLRRTGKALSPDPARLKALLAPTARPVPSPLSVSLYVRTALSALVLVLVVTGVTWSTTPTSSPDDFAQLGAVIEEDLADEAAVVALLDQGVDAAFVEEDVFTDEFLDSVL